MYLKDLAASLLRRWYLFLVAVLIAAAGCWGVVRMVGPTYEQTAGIVLMPPPSPADPGANRYLQLSSLSQAVDVLVRSVGNDATHEEVARVAGPGEYLVAPDSTTSAPIVTITASAKTQTAATATLTAALTRVPINLADLQANLSIPNDNRITSIVVSQDKQPKIYTKGMIRAGGAVTVLLLVLLCPLIGALDGFLLRRRRRIGPHRIDPWSDRRNELRHLSQHPEESDTPEVAERAAEDRRTLLRGRVR